MFKPNVNSPCARYAPKFVIAISDSFMIRIPYFMYYSHFLIVMMLIYSQKHVQTHTFHPTAPNQVATGTV